MFFTAGWIIIKGGISVKKKKELRDLNLMDRFLFSEAMEDREFAEDVLSIILGEEIYLKNPPQAEKELRNSTLNKTIKLDVWADDVYGRLYDTEVQNKNTKNIPRRSRYYQGFIDCNLLESGDIEYNGLNDTEIIMIAPFDLFGAGRYLYRFRPVCIDDKEIVLEDGTERIFLNTRGTDTENITPELKSLLEFFESTTEETAQRSECDRIQSMYRKIDKIKSNGEIGVKYMGRWEEIELEKQDARIEGREEGRVEGRKEGYEESKREIAANLKKAGVDNEIIAAGTGLSLEEIEGM